MFPNIKKVVGVPMKTDAEVNRVEIIMLKFKEEEVIDEAIKRIIHNTDWPFKLTIYDNRVNTANTARIWNKLVNEATCDTIMLIDSDAYVPQTKTSPCWLTRMMESIKDTGLVIPVSNAQGGQGQHRNIAEPYPSVERNKGIWSGYCFLFTKEAYKKIGPFDERFYIYGQDSEWAYRAKKIGGAAMRKDILVEHIGGYSFKSDPIRDEDKIYAGTLYRNLTSNE